MLASSTSMDSESKNYALENPCRFIAVEIRSKVKTVEEDVWKIRVCNKSPK